MQTYNTTYFSKAPLFTFIYGIKLVKKSTDLSFSRIEIEHLNSVALLQNFVIKFGQIWKNN